MFKQELIRLRNFIVVHNSYFDTSFSDAWQDEESGYIMATNDNGDRVPVFPEEKYDNYFYLRNEKSASVLEDRRFNITDEHKHGILFSGRVYLVCVLSNADENVLIKNMVNTLGIYSNDLVINAVDWQREDVTIREMKYADDKEIAAALQRIKPNQSIVSVSFTLKSPLQYQELNQNCLLQNPLL